MSKPEVSKIESDSDGAPDLFDLFLARVASEVAQRSEKMDERDETTRDVFSSLIANIFVGDGQTFQEQRQVTRWSEATDAARMVDIWARGPTAHSRAPQPRDLRAEDVLQ